MAMDEAKMQNQRYNGEMAEGQTQPSRPPNGFLMFCQGHRDIVSSNNPAMQNRHVTKMLALWWAELDISEKQPFYSQAQEYREILKKKHPSFRWHSRRQASAQMAPVTRNNTRNSVFSPGKLADESQMGSLSCLMLSTAASAKRSPDHDLSNNNNEGGNCHVDGCALEVSHQQQSGSVKRKQRCPKKLELNEEEPDLQKKSIQSSSGSDSGRDSPDFREYAGQCPTYSYEDFVLRRKHTKKTTKKPLKKRKAKKSSVKKAEKAASSAKTAIELNHFSLLLLAIDVVEAAEKTKPAEDEAMEVTTDS